MLLHVVGAHLVAVHAKTRVALRQVSGLDVRDLKDGGQASVLRQGHGDVIQRISEGTNGVLFDARHRLGKGRHSERAGDLRRASAVHHTVVLDEVAHHAHGIVQRPLGLVHDHLVSSADQHGHGIGEGAVLDDQHALLGGAEAYLAHRPSLAQLFRRQLLETRHNSSASGDSDQLQLDTTNPSHGRQLILQQQVVRLVVEAPLADDQVGATVLAALHHILEVFLLPREQALVGVFGGDIQLMLSLGLGRLEGAGEDAHLHVLEALGHLRVAELLVDHDAVDQLRLLQAATRLAFHLNHIEVNILRLKVGHGEHRVHSDLCHLALVHIDNLGAQGGHGRVDEGHSIVGSKLHLVGDGLQVLERHL
mmetsp:Transcript_9052/g.15310  ORF Transcript_9052/g.15310 Transcript_9052/m.15310 type:complete len:364 (+) Transcript_9052:294-1385(+)